MSLTSYQAAPPRDLRFRASFKGRAGASFFVTRGALRRKGVLERDFWEWINRWGKVCNSREKIQFLLKTILRNGP
jgi:hypothetical protein